MKQMLVFTLGLIVIGWVLCTAGPVKAATSAGPYYAPPAWDQTLPSDTRFIVLSNFRGEEPGPGGTTIVISGLAVLDRETGLVWEQSPSTNTFIWTAASVHCNRLSVGNRKGWRLPTAQELGSLVDPSVPFPGPTLPASHPFSNVQSGYWSANANADNAERSWIVEFANGQVGILDKSIESFAWCVRGGHGVDLQ